MTLINPLDRLKAQLLSSGLQQKNFPLYQVINQLIDALRQTISETNAWISSSSGSGSSPTSTAGTNVILGFPCSLEGEPGEDGMMGTTGKDGTIGPQGVQGFPGIPGMDGIDGEPGNDSLIPGPPGLIGNTGPAGPSGMPGPPGIDAEEHEIPYIIPGPQGPAGTSGGGGSATTIEVNLGSTAKFTGNFTITDVAITSSSKVLCWQAPGPYTGKGTRADEAELQPVSIVSVYPASGSAVVRWQTPPIVTRRMIPRIQFMYTGTTLYNWPKDPEMYSRGEAKRLGKVKGNVKFSYVVFA